MKEREIKGREDIYLLLSVPSVLSVVYLFLPYFSVPHFSVERID